MTVDALERTLNPDRCRSATWFIDCDDPSIRGLAERCGTGGASFDRAVALFRLVRDEIRYEFSAKLRRPEYRASHVLAQGRGFCVQKAVLLCALARAAGIPAAIVFSDLRDHTLPAALAAAMGTDVMHHHGVAALFLEGRWRLVDPSLSPDIVSRKRYRTVELDRDHGDALLHSTCVDGSAHAEYVAYHGMFADLPFTDMMSAFMRAYAGADVAALDKLGHRF